MQKIAQGESSITIITAPDLPDNTLQKLLTAAPDYTIQTWSDATPDMLETGQVHLVIADVTDIDQIKKIAAQTPVWVTVSDAQLPLLDAALEAGAADYLLTDHLNADRLLARFELLRQAAAVETLTLEKQLLENYAHTIAHNLRSPLNMILFCADVLNEEIEAPDLKDLVTKIIDVTLGVNEMTNQLLKLASLEAVKGTMKTVDDIHALVDKVLLRIENEIQKRDVKITVGELPPVAGHGPWIAEIFANLITNAVKYIGMENPEPEVTVSGEKNGTRVIYRVQDNGLGIPDDQKGEIWKRFSRFHKGEALGMGLGLYIVMQLVHMQKGEVGFESKEGEGSTFWFSLPLEAGTN